MPDQKRYGDILLEDVEIKDLSNVRQVGSMGGAPSNGPATRVGGQNIVTVEIPKEQAVQSFEPGKLHDTKGVRYSEVVKGMPNAAVQKSARFRLSDLVRGPLSVEAEEEQRIEAEVQARLAQRIEDLREQTTEAAFREGFEAGRQAGMEQVLTESEPKLKAVEELARQFDSMKVEVFKASEDFLLHMVNQLARNVILRELKEDPAYTRRLATHLVERVGTRENIKLFIGEKELSSAEELKAGLAQTLGQLKNISVEPDPSIVLGGCRIETEFGEVDGRIEVQIESIAQGLGVTQGS